MGDAKCDALDSKTVEIVQLWCRLTPGQRVEILRALQRMVGDQVATT